MVEIIFQHRDESSFSLHLQYKVFTSKSKPHEKIPFTWFLTPILIQGSGGGAKDLVSPSPQQTHVDSDPLGIPTALWE